MKLLCDEHVPPAVANALRGEGIDATSLSEELGSGTKDTDLLDYAAKREYIVLTNDTDFVGETGHAGILYYDDQQVSPRILVCAIRNVDDRLPDEEPVDRTLFVPDGWV
jgi:predicted nuclease of predicted toxin-antitoxin system